MSGRQLSTSLSDAVLAYSAFHACIRLVTTSMTGLLGFLLIGTAAAFGIRRFGSSRPDAWTINMHNYYSWLARVLGMSCIAAAYYRSHLYSSSTMANGHLAAAIAVVALQHLGILTDKGLHLATELVGSGAVISTLINSILAFNPYGVIGTVLYAVAALAVGTTGKLYLIQRVDIFHYLLVLGNFALLIGLVQPDRPIFYRG